jgi:excisionase family DNA binding protein
MSNNQNYLTSKELAEILNMHPQYVRDLARIGHIPSMKVGSSWRFNLAEVSAKLKYNAAIAVQRSMGISDKNN